ncbi:hypothetical protein M634_11135 [Vibrio parahaemolyticus O1:Kuk str. FDA_R31]|nr:hypothetical protein M634_11135 [Vibrio parahaemolyticus O1:Kuk str. FDA_R31]ODW63681.1 hypothetical protein BBL89_16395 [Vibrio parahaemolyticus]ODW67053.1 hypothetical protein BBL90_10805 [Vibrio parahaemolyticus]
MQWFRLGGGVAHYLTQRYALIRNNKEGCLLLIELVQKFCSAFEDELNSSDYLDSELCSFPNGSCEATSQMLALYLQSAGIADVVYTKNETDQLEVGSIHYWVVVENKVIIDLTAHQFDEFKGTHVCSVDSEFHGLFKQLSTSVPNKESLWPPFTCDSNIKFFERLMVRLERA